MSGPARRERRRAQRRVLRQDQGSVPIGRLPSRWFYAPFDAWLPDVILLPAREAHHAVKVMRIAAGESITVTDGEGRAAACTVEVDGERVIARIGEVVEKAAPTPRLGVFQAAAKGHKLDDVVERLAELGVARFSCFTSTRTVARWDRDKTDKLMDRWGGIARAAAKQSRRPHLMRLEAGWTWSALVEATSASESALLLWEGASAPLRAALPDAPGSIDIIVGPEGGFSSDEADELVAAGAAAVSLGDAVLRTENAALVTASAVSFHYGLIG
ncbi:MAG TPA: RsmE family RNA methyltransferase [Actinomycetota bacterium]|nr:RsmE family RNA methyltransferase [Actinomycetota bacterium]